MVSLVHYHHHNTKKPQHQHCPSSSINATADRLYVANKHIRDERIDTVAAAATLFLCKSLE